MFQVWFFYGIFRNGILVLQKLLFREISLLSFFLISLNKSLHLIFIWSFINLAQTRKLLLTSDQFAVRILDKSDWPPLFHSWKIRNFVEFAKVHYSSLGDIVEFANVYYSGSDDWIGISRNIHWICERVLLEFGGYCWICKRVLFRFGMIELWIEFTKVINSSSK